MPKPGRVSLHTIARRHLPLTSSSWSQEEILEKLNAISHLRLDRENIGEIDSLELLGKSVKNVYLQNNKIRRIENFECLPCVQFLTLSCNEISCVEGLLCLSSLKFLDLSNNKIEELQIDELPQSLIILDLRNNPCTQKPHYRENLVHQLPNLRQLDGVELVRKECLEEGLELTTDGEEDEEDDSPLTFRETTNEILCRSQQNLEESFTLHKKRLSDLEDVRSSSDLSSRGHSTQRSAWNEEDRHF
ncbi:hypothetical protein CAPTEDRAFT_203432 [Capitella teleta]|uniref:U2A'/phosphoprotein 32 family A C-terminal domain-containing protein n=1 Tax=Capitella teleta TaxID=283909 RepID=R7VID8_CAPTE|nr:hypothetical protein CAPTEDRAFT_203432 [Capitella teleta]|eukprot:ELU15480.1 hypothetical protein CAPTEDRAFT_203432 [Capitella teleta]